VKHKAVKGMKDILPKAVQQWRYIESQMQEVLASYGYLELRLPVLEYTRLFSRTIGEGTDIVSKEMYTFKEKGGDEVSLRPEATASIVRAYVEHSLDREWSLAKLYCLGPMFRTERPQAGRQRQFHQLSVEAIGSRSALVDVEIIVLLVDLLNKAGLSEYILRLNSVGCGERTCRPAYIAQLQAYFNKHLGELCKECQGRHPDRVWRILDCKKEACQKVVSMAPSILDTIKESPCDCNDHFAGVQEGLGNAKVEFELCPHLVRGLDYYTKTAFEVAGQGLGAQDAVAAGGRYDRLSKELGGPHVGGVGMAVGIERLLLALEAKQGLPESKKGNSVFLALLGVQVTGVALPLVRRLRARGVVTHFADDPSRSLKSQMRQADRLGCRWIVMLGERELEKSQVVVKDLAERKQEEIKMDSLIDQLVSRTKE
jgi:histidyl-tRNA synthetase